MKNENGMALLLTLLIVALLTILTVGMSGRSLLALTRARNSVSALDASYIMRSGVSVAMGLIERDARDNAIDSLSPAWIEEIMDFPVREGTVSIRIGDEASRFNINTLVDPRGAVDSKAVERFGRLLKLVGREERLSAQAAEWLRSNRGSLAYTFRDASELLLVPGWGSEAVKEVEKYVTVFTDRMNARNININTVGKEVLAALSPKLSEAVVESIMTARRRNPLKGIGQLRNVQGMSDDILYSFSDVIDVRSSNFSVRAEAKVRTVVRRGSALVRRDGGKVRMLAWKEE